MAAKYKWEPKGDWTPNENGPVCSRFAFDAGDLVNGKAVNQKGYAARWKIGDGEAKTLSDVAILQLKAESISIAGVGSTPLPFRPTSRSRCMCSAVLTSCTATGSTARSAMRCC